MRCLQRCRRLVAGMLLFAAAAMAAAAPRALPAYHVDLGQTTVSGVSSGAYMAGQFAVAYSSIVSGAGLVAGGPYFCAGTPGIGPYIPYLVNSISVCTNPAAALVDPPDALYLWDRAQDFARAGLIDDVANLRRQSVYLFSGSNDRAVTTAVAEQARNFYQFAGAATVRFIVDPQAGHGMITDSATDNPCGSSSAPFFNFCQRAAAREILETVYPNLNPPAARASGDIVRFDQGRYTLPFSSMSAAGFLYVPLACRSQSCRVHVAFHGCFQDVATVRDHFYASAGYNRVADTNHIIVLYPQVEPSPRFPYNPYGCWDFWGYSSPNPLLPDFYTRHGAQMRAVRAMLERLAQPRGAALPPRIR